MNGWIAYVGPFKFPRSAAGRRVLGNAQALSGRGIRVYVLSGEYKENSGQISYCNLEGVHHVSMGNRNSETTNPLSRIFDLFTMALKSRKWIRSQQTRPKAIILYSGYLPYLLLFTNWAKRRKIPILFDAVEWYTPPSYIRLFFSPYYWSIEISIRWLMPKLDGVIAISTAFSEYFKKRGLPVLRIPPTLSVENLPYSIPKKKKNNKVDLVYAGIPMRKDLLNTIVEAVIRLDTLGDRICLHIAGPTEEQIRALPSLRPWQSKRLPSSIVSHGHLSHSRTLALVHDVSFSILLRPRNRVSKYGFATKFVESFAVGTPVIANYTGDLRFYLYNGVNGFVCRRASAESMVEAIRKACNINASEYQILSMNARRKAEVAFECSNYSQSLLNFVEMLKTEANERA